MTSRVPTKFESSVYELTKAVPRGKVTTYGAIARRLHSSPLAVGQALKRNPFAPVVPCHRVVASDFKLGGFCGSADPASAQLKRKKRMLEEEGVLFEASDSGDKTKKSVNKVMRVSVVMDF